MYIDSTTDPLKSLHRCQSRSLRSWCGVEECTHPREGTQISNSVKALEKTAQCGEMTSEGTYQSGVSGHTPSWEYQGTFETDWRDWTVISNRAFKTYIISKFPLKSLLLKWQKKKKDITLKCLCLLLNTNKVQRTGKVQKCEVKAGNWCPWEGGGSAHLPHAMHRRLENGPLVVGQRWDLKSNPSRGCTSIPCPNPYSRSLVAPPPAEHRFTPLAALEGEVRLPRWQSFPLAPDFIEGQASIKAKRKQVWCPAAWVQIPSLTSTV